MQLYRLAVQSDPYRSVLLSPQRSKIIQFGAPFTDEKLFFSPMSLRPNAGHVLLIHKVFISHTTTHHSR